MKRFLKFVATSLVGGTVDMVLVWLLSGYVFSGYWGEVVVTPMISFECSVIVGFAFCWLFVWNDRVEKGDSRSFLKSLGAFNLSNIGVFVLRMVLVMLLERVIADNLLICNLIARMLAGLLNFIISDRLIFKIKRNTI